MAKPKSEWQLTLDSGHLADGAAGIPPEHWCRVFFAQVLSAFAAEPFADLYAAGGRVGAEGLRRLGEAGYQVLARCGERAVKHRDTLAQILAENFATTPAGELRALEPEERPADRIATPHEPDVRWGKERERTWLGDKVQLVETAEAGATNFVVDVQVTDPRQADAPLLPELAQRSSEGWAAAPGDGPATGEPPPGAPRFPLAPRGRRPPDGDGAAGGLPRPGTRCPAPTSARQTAPKAAASGLSGLLSEEGVPVRSSRLPSALSERAPCVPEAAPPRGHPHGVKQILSASCRRSNSTPSR